MGIFDLLTGGSGPQKALKLKPKILQKYGDPTTRQKAIAQLGEMKFPEAVSVLLSRFTVTVEPQTTDAEEKDHVLELICGFRQDAIAPVREFLEKSDQASSWAIRILTSLLPEAEVVGVCTELLQSIGAGYSRDPQKKLVLLGYLEGIDDPRIAPAALPFLEDMSDEVKIAALKTLGHRKHEPAREPMLQLVTAEDTSRRVRSACIAALADSEFGVQGYREKVEAQLAEPYFVDRSGQVKKRG